MFTLHFFPKYTHVKDFESKYHDEVNTVISQSPPTHLNNI